MHAAEQWQTLTIDELRLLTYYRRLPAEKQDALVSILARWTRDPPGPNPRPPVGTAQCPPVSFQVGRTPEG
ncbi:MAG TPA: hypothetical protein VMY42_26415 [Thermoguttaceae bacterium]|nr:hypothetical protein [Thermoguttaceae bacterium]